MSRAEGQNIDDFYGDTIFPEASDLKYIQKDTENEMRQRVRAIENSAYKTALEEVAGGLYEKTYYESFHAGLKIGQKEAKAMFTRL